MNFLIPALGGAALFAGSAMAAVSPIQFTFDTDLEGWTASMASIEWVADSGGPGGYLKFTEDIGLSEIVAPALFQGDLSAFSGGVLRFDIRRFSPLAPPGSPPAFSSDFLTIEGNVGGTARALFGLEIPSEWTTYEISINDIGFTDNVENLSLILADVAGFRISPDLHGLPEIVEMYGIDNVTLVPVPAPGSATLCVVGLIALHRRRS